MPGPNNPPFSTAPVPPPFQNLPFGQVRAGGDVFLSTTAIQFLQELWASIQGQDGILSLLIALAYSPGQSAASAAAIIDQLAAQYAMAAERGSDTPALIALMQDVALSVQAPPRPPPSTVSRTSSQSLPADPTVPASTVAYAMQGLAGTITPSVDGDVLVIIAGTVVSPAGTAAGLGISYQLSYGTGAVPVNGAAITGTQVGVVQTYTNPAIVAAAADVHVPFSLQSIITGVVAGTPYWLDLAAISLVTASDMGLASIVVTALEL